MKAIAGFLETLSKHTSGFDSLFGEYSLSLYIYMHTRNYIKEIHIYCIHVMHLTHCSSAVAYSKIIANPIILHAAMTHTDFTQCIK